MKIFVIVNPVAGKIGANNKVDIEAILNKQGYDFKLFMTEIDKGPFELLQSFDSTFSAVLVSGGDGTVSETINAFHRLKITVPLEIVPSGTTNDFASNFVSNSRTPTLFDGEVLKLDIGLCEDHKTIMYALSFGNFTDVTYRTPQSIKNKLGYNAYILFGLLSFRKIQSYTLTIRTEHHNYNGKFVFGSVTNTERLANIMDFSKLDVAFDDGQFEVFLIRKPKNISQLRTILHGIRNNDYDNEMFIIFKTSEIEINSSREISWNHDGEYGGTSKYKSMRVLHQRIKLFTS